MRLIAAFGTGLLCGGLSCVATQGGLLLGAFVLGTMPVFAAVGLAAGRATQGAGGRTAKFRSAIGAVVLVTALLSLDSQKFERQQRWLKWKRRNSEFPEISNLPYRERP